MLAEILDRPLKFRREIVVEIEAVLRETDRRREDLFARQRAVFFQHVEQSRDAAGHARRKMRLRRQPRHDVAALIEIHVALCARRRALAVVVRHDAAIAQPDHHQSAAADVTRGRIRHRQRETGGNRRIDRVATRTHDVRTHRRRNRGARSDHTVSAVNCFGTCCKRELRDEDEDETDKPTACAIHAVLFPWAFCESNDGDSDRWPRRPATYCGASRSMRRA